MFAPGKSSAPSTSIRFHLQKPFSKLSKCRVVKNLRFHRIHVRVGRKRMSFQIKTDDNGYVWMRLQ